MGDSRTFTPERMRLVGAIVYREANRIGVSHPFFAPTILDGGVTKYTTGQVSAQVVGGFLEALATEAVINRIEAEVPEGEGYKDFGSFKICGHGSLPKTFLISGQAARGKAI